MSLQPTTDDHPEWEPAGPRARRCQCGAFVTSDWARVLGDNQNTVHSCPSCGNTYRGGARGGRQR